MEFEDSNKISLEQHLTNLSSRPRIEILKKLHDQIIPHTTAQYERYPDPRDLPTHPQDRHSSSTQNPKVPILPLVDYQPGSPDLPQNSSRWAPTASWNQPYS